MTRDDVKQLMMDAGLKAPAKGDFIFIHWDQIALLIQHEREECAKECEDGASTPEELICAKLIRARGQK
jgi:hypothetical protein